MKISIDLDEVYGYDDATVAQIIRDEVTFRLKDYAKTAVKEAIKEHEKEIKEFVRKAVKRDWNLVDEILIKLQEKK